MFVLKVEFEKELNDKITGEKRYLTFRDPRKAEAGYTRFDRLVDRPGSVRIKSGGKATFTDCRLYKVNSEDRLTARQLIESGQATLIKDAHDPTVEDPGFWDMLFADLEESK
jgi:hypothetical protein